MGFGFVVVVSSSGHWISFSWGIGSPRCLGSAQMHFGCLPVCRCGRFQDLHKKEVRTENGDKTSSTHRLSYIVYRISCVHSICIYFFGGNFLQFDRRFFFFFQTNHNESLGPYQVLIKSCRSFDSVARLMSTHTKSGGFEVIISLRFMIHKYVSLFR